MSKRHSHRRRRTDHCGHRHGPVKQVIRGLSDRFGVSRGVVIAGFVLGFIFVPLLAVFVFLGTLYWVHHTEQVETHVEKAADWIRDWWKQSKQKDPPQPGQQSSADVESAAQFDDLIDIDMEALNEEFAELERRAAGIESFVLSDEYRLHRDFKKMGSA